ncbi:MAG: hypothetical protein ACT4QF_19010 [Sporichthyaceae bacterium]
MTSLFRDRSVGGDDGYALISVIGLGTAMLLSVGAVSAYSLQAMRSAGSTQGFHASVQAAQAGVDQFASKLNTAASPADITAAIGAGATWQPIPGSQDGAGTTCTTVSGGSLPPNCPKFRYTVTQNGSSYEIVSSGYSRGDVRSVKVTLRQQALTDYLYYSAVEAADPADRFFYPLGSPNPACANPSWGPSTRPVGGCVEPTWRGGDTTDGSRVHTSDAFKAVGNPDFDSRITVASTACAANPASCVVGGTPTYQAGNPSYADDLTMPGPEGLALVSAAASVVGGCTYYGPTRIKFEGNKMRVWSPQTPADLAGTPAQQRCGGGVDPTLLNRPVNILVTTLNRTGVCNLLNGLGLLDAVLSLACALGGILGQTVQLPLSSVIGNDLLTGLGLSQVLAGVAAEGNVVDLRPNMAIYVRDNPVGTSASPLNPPDPTGIECLVSSALGMYGSLDTNLTAGLLDAANTPATACRAGKLFVDADQSKDLDGQVTIGVNGDILIMSSVEYAGSDDRLGMVATGPIEVYNSLQCTLAASTCLSLQPIGTTVLNALTGVRSAVWSGDLTTLLQTVPGYGQPINVHASLISLQHRVGVQLPLLSPSLSASLINQLVNLNITPPALTIKGSVAQYYRGATSVDLLNIVASAGVGAATINLANANADIGYRLKLEYDSRLTSNPPLYLPQAGTARWIQASFAEVAAVN